MTAPYLWCAGLMFFKGQKEPRLLPVARGSFRAAVLGWGDGRAVQAYAVLPSISITHPAPQNQHVPIYYPGFARNCRRALLWRARSKFRSESVEG